MNEYTQPSDIGELHARHSKALVPCSGLLEQRSFSIDKKGYSFELIKRLLFDCSKLTDRAFVVVEHDTCFEVRRINDGSNPETFYYAVELESKPTIEKRDTRFDCVDEMRRVMVEYLKLDFEYLRSYMGRFDESTRDASIIPRMYLQRRLSTLSCYRNYKDGAKAALKLTLRILVESGELELLDTEKSSAILYKII